MSDLLGPIDVACEAPSYSIVQATRRIGFVRPEDVRWSRLSRRLLEQQVSHQGLSDAPPRRARSSRHAHEPSCVCGHPLPVLRRVTFTFTSGAKACYFMVQCCACAQVLWDEA
jgi:hypothetical protein